MTARTTKPDKRLPGPVRRRQLLDAARRTFLQHGVHGTRTRQIAETAGVPEALLYHYFSSKEELFEAAIVEPLERMVDQLFELLAESLTDDTLAPEETVRRGLRTVLEAMREMLPSLGMVLYSNEAEGRAFYREHFYPLMMRSHEVASEFLERLTGQPLDPMFISAVSGMCINVTLDAWLREPDVDLDQLADYLARLVLFGAVGTVLTPSAGTTRSGKRKEAKV